MEFQFKNVRTALAGRIKLLVVESSGRRADAEAKYRRGSRILVQENAARVHELLELIGAGNAAPGSAEEVAALRQRGRLLKAQLNLENGRQRGRAHEIRKNLGKNTRQNHLALAFLHLRALDQVESEKSSPVKAREVWLNMLFALGVDTQGVHRIEKDPTTGKKISESFSDDATFEVVYKDTETRKILKLHVGYPLFANWLEARGANLSVAGVLQVIGEMAPRQEHVVEIDSAQESVESDEDVTQAEYQVAPTL